MRKAILALLTALIALALVLSAYTLTSRNEADPADIDAVVRQAHKQSGGAQEQERGLRPAPGTYVYVGRGSDSVDALGGSTHTYAHKVPLVVKLGDDCEWSYEVTFVQQHVERHTYCTTASSLRHVAIDQEVEFFRTTEKTHLSCSKRAFRLAAGSKQGEQWSYSCAGDKRRLEYIATYMGEERLTIGSARVPARHVRLKNTLSGVTTGRETLDFWYARSGLPLRFETDIDVQSESVLGDTKYTDHASYTLSSTKPR